MWPIFRFLMSTHMVPFAVYSAFETSQFQVQDGGSHKACVNNSKICAKAWGKWRQNRIIPSLLLRKIGSDCWRTALIDWLKFWISLFFSGVNSYAKYRKEVDFPISFKNLRGPVAGNKLQRCA